IVSTRDFTRTVEESREYTAARMLEKLQESQQWQTSHPRPVLGTSYVEPRNELESQLAELWRELLGLEQVGAEDNFFELGGHSLLALQLLSRLRALHQVELPLCELMEASTIAKLARMIESARQAEPGLQLPPLVPVSRENDLPLSST